MNENLSINRNLQIFIDKILLVRDFFFPVTTIPTKKIETPWMNKTISSFANFLPLFTNYFLCLKYLCYLSYLRFITRRNGPFTIFLAIILPLTFQSCMLIYFYLFIKINVHYYSYQLRTPLENYRVCLLYTSPSPRDQA